MARCMSALDASATSPMTSSVAGLVFVNVPASPSTSMPSIIIFGSNRTVGVSGILLASSQRAEARNPHHQSRHLVQARGGKKSVGDQQHSCVGTNGLPGE